jgi:outer membrane immunogenic protein
VLGVEVDYQWANINGSGTAGGITDSARVRDFGTARARVGYAWDRWLVYGTGGWAFDARTRYSFVTPAGPTGSRELDGWAAGAGVEYAFAPNWSAKLEYLHVDLDRRNYPTVVGCAATACTVGANLDTVRLGLNYRFWGGR